MTKKVKYAGIVIGIFLAMGSWTHSWSSVQGACSNCHTMHNSQGGVEVVGAGGGPLPALLVMDCIGCHQGQNTGSNDTPFVFDPSGPSYSQTGTESNTNTLAGGNFYWVSMGSDATGHNVAGIAGVDSRHGNTPPGGTALSAQLTCAGTNGCHGNRAILNPVEAIRGSHHNHNVQGWKTGTSLATSYRFLDGIQGLEDPGYEYQPTSTSHNKYYGIDRYSETDSAVGTISYLCSECHGDFHNGSGKLVPSGGSFTGGVWLRHPTDFDMSNAISHNSEYMYYNGGTGTNNPYSVVSPVATSDTSTNVNNYVFALPDDAIVMCLSCHRAHGTPYDAILRWDYKSWPGGGYNGCAVCHTSKD